MGKNIRTFEQFINESYNVDEFDLVLESATDVYRRLAMGNKMMMRSLFNEAKKKGYNLDASMKYEEMSVEAALKIKDQSFLKFWLNEKNEIVVVTLGNSLLYYTFQAKDKIRGTDLRYFRPKYMYGNDETYNFIRGGNYAITKFKNYLKDKASTAIVVNIGSIPQSDDNRTFDKTLEKYADKYNIGVIDGSDGEAYTEAMTTNTPLFVKNPRLGIFASDKDRRLTVKTGKPSNDLDDKKIVMIFNEFKKRIPLDRSTAAAASDSSSVIKSSQGGVDRYELRLSYADKYGSGGGKLIPNPALINSVFDKFGVYPVKAFFSDYFLTVDFATAPSPKAAQMSTGNPHTALFNGHVNDAYERALADASPKVKSHANRIGKEVMLLWNDGDLEDPEYRQFFTDLVMYYTKAEKLPGEQADVFAKAEKEILAI